MNNKTLLITTIALVVVILGLSLNSANKVADSTIKIGFVGPFTGNSAIFGDFMQRGIDFAESELSSEQKVKIKIIKEDDMCKGEKAVSAINKLISLDHVNYVIGPLCNEASLATEKLFEENKVISVTIGLPSNKIAAMGPYHFAFSPEIEYLMKTLTAEMAKRELKRVAVIHMSAAFEDENYTHFKKYFVEGDGQIVADENVIKGTTDFRNAVLKIKAARPDSIVIIAHTGELNNILKQLNEQGMSALPKFGIHAAETPVLAKEPVVGNGLIYPYPADKTANASALDYAEKYKAKYNADPDPSSTNVYDSFKILLGAINECGYENKDCVQQKLASLQNYQGANGSLSVDARGVGTYKEIMLKQFKDGAFVNLEE